MGRSRYVARYPAEYLTLAGEFEGSRPKRSRTLVCMDKTEALRLRLDLYGFIGALQAERMTEDYPNFVVCRFFVEGRKLVIRHVDDCVPNSLKRKGK